MRNIVNFQQIITFALLWIAYGSTYLLRKPFGIIKSGIQDSLDVSDSSIGYLDFSFSLPYAFVSLFFGFIGDKVGPRITLGIGLMGAALANSVMGVVNKFYQMCCLLFISGSFQSLCWPAACANLSSWFRKEKMSSIMVIFGSCMLVGSICSSFITVALESQSDWRNVFVFPSLATAIAGALTITFTKPRTSSIEQRPDLENTQNFILAPLNEVEQQKDLENTKHALFNKENKIVCSTGQSKKLPNLLDLNRAKPMPIWKVIRIPTVIEVSIALLFSKGLRAAVTYWLPLYLQRVLNYDIIQAGIIPLTFDVGGLIGSVALVIAVEKIFKSSDLMTCMVSSVLCALTLFLLLLCDKAGKLYLLVLLFLSGAFSSVVDILLCGSFPSKLGEEVSAKASVVGAVNGIGSLGYVIEGPLVGYVSAYFGISFIVHILGTFSLLSFVCTLKAYITHNNLLKASKEIEDEGAKTLMCISA